MSETIEIKLFGGFTILKGNKKILENLANTRKTKLFVAYLIANREKAISHQELFELLWSGEDYANPATALRTLLYRFRNMIEKEGAEDLAGAIVSRKGTYQWNTKLDVSIDVLEFQKNAEAGKDMNQSLSDRKSYLEAAIGLYQGSLLPDFCSEPWLISKAATYRDMYIEVVKEYIEILKSEKEYKRIVELCAEAKELAGVSELIDLEMQMAKIRIASPTIKNENAGFDYYETYKSISENLLKETDNIQDELEDDMVEQKAYLCDYNTFKEIYRLQRRMQSRSKATIFLGLIDVRCDNAEEESNYELIDDIVECCQRQLRCGDAICKRNDTQLAILFPAESYEDAMGVLERLKTASRERTLEDLIFVYRVRPLKNARE